MNFYIRTETPADYDQTKEVVREAFREAEHTDHDEHELIGRLRDSKSFIPELSLVAVDRWNDAIIGHILLTKIKIQQGEGAYEALALAPLSVLPDYQHQGVGSALMESALSAAKRLGYQAVIVLGHADYYPKFGFRKAAEWGITAPFPVLDESFLALELQPNGLDGSNGVVVYDPAFFA